MNAKMKVVILAGGLGTRLGEETSLRPKPMVEIGGRPILWHIMKIYSAFGFNDFIILCGYKGEVIKEYFANYYLKNSDITIDLSDNSVQFHRRSSEQWRITLCDTGRDTLTGGRIKRAEEFVKGERFMLTYGDGVADIDLRALLASHEASGLPATLTAVRPTARFGVIEMDAENRVTNFQEKPRGDNVWINGGFFVLEPEIFGYIKDGDSTVWEREPLQTLSASGLLNAYRHEGFWRPMDMLKDKKDLNEMWDCGRAPWKIWKD